MASCIIIFCQEFIFKLITYFANKWIVKWNKKRIIYKHWLFIEYGILNLVCDWLT